MTIFVRVTGYAAAAVREVAEHDTATCGKLLPEELAARAAYQVLSEAPPEFWSQNFTAERGPEPKTNDDTPFEVTPSDTIVDKAREIAEQYSPDVSPIDVIRRAIWYAACEEKLVEVVQAAIARELDDYETSRS